MAVHAWYKSSRDRGGVIFLPFKLFVPVGTCLQAVVPWWICNGTWEGLTIYLLNWFCLLRFTRQRVRINWNWHIEAMSEGANKKNWTKSQHLLRANQAKKHQGGSSLENRSDHFASLPRERCPHCSEVYLPESKAVQCDLCRVWAHAECEGISVELYDKYNVMYGVPFVSKFSDKNSHIIENE